MKLSVETFTLDQKYGYEQTIKMLKEAGFDSIDYSFYNLGDTKEQEILGENYIAYAYSVRKYLDDNGMTCNQAHAPFYFKYGGNFDVSNPEYNKIVRSMESAAIMGAENIIVHYIGTPVEEDCFDYNFRFYKSLEPYCEKFHICIAIENLFYTDTKCNCCRGRLQPELLCKMVKLLQSPWFVICLDVGHAAIIGCEPENLIKGLDGHTLKALHIHDNDYLSDKHMLPFTGNLDWENIMNALKEVEYKGDLTLEILGFLSKISDGLMKDTLQYAAKVGRYLIKMYETL